MIFATGGEASQVSDLADAWGVISKVGVGGLLLFAVYCLVSKRFFVQAWYAKELEQRLADDAAAAEKRATEAKADAEARIAALTSERDAARVALAEQNDFMRTDVVPLFTKGIAALADANREAEHRRWTSGGASNGT